ncbi:hypothetical protein ACF0H5_021374 [Mactra antiquata]
MQLVLRLDPRLHTAILHMVLTTTMTNNATNGNLTEYDNILNRNNANNKITDDSNTTVCPLYLGHT